MPSATAIAAPIRAIPISFRGGAVGAGVASIRTGILAGGEDGSRPRSGAGREQRFGGSPLEPPVQLAVRGAIHRHLDQSGPGSQRPPQPAEIGYPVVGKAEE